ncbi:hypothetical protein E1A91_A11G115100v1 [Gossypium mustelinum]|uniref:Protein kinase domain-containing protein n=1 Tax=Gossypium mustelinum TaxID=34275 RepID=A0A5D2X4P3_GOSMU|nr:hypothetical protein E1A91_A11G115100v1 [Gossypium mustelinum]
MSDNFGTNSLIGESSYGRVYYRLKTGQASAIKEVRCHFLWYNFVQLLGYCIDGSSRILAYEFHLMAHCMIFSMVWRKGVEGAQPCPGLTWAQREKITVVAAKGLEYSHEKADPRIIHCDGKSCNVLEFDDVENIADCIPNIAARLHLTYILGTVGYHAPELYCSTSYDTMAAVSELCVQFEADFRPTMSTVVKALQPLLNA